DRHLIGGAADAARADFEGGTDVVERAVEDLQRILAGLLGDGIEGTVENRFGDRLLAGIHHAVHEARENGVSEFRIRQNFTALSSAATRHTRISLLRTLGAVLRTALLAVFDALRIEAAADDVITHARQILDA